MRIQSTILLVLVLTLAVPRDLNAQTEADPPKFSKQEQLRGSITPERAWWDVKHYDLSVRVFPDSKRIEGSNRISFSTLKSGRKMQIDLQPPLNITRIEHEEKQVNFVRRGNVYWVMFDRPLAQGVDEQVTVFYEGHPCESQRPPWDGGFSWQRDDQGNHFIATSCQKIGASIWWPNKDHGYDEPDDGMNIRVTVPENLTAVSNGRLKKTDHDPTEKTKTFHWQVTNPINNYGVNVNIGKYVNFSEKYPGEGGALDLDYWVLNHQRKTAETHFREVPRTIKAFEHWFGRYPFYEDSFKLVVVPYLGMEHQSSVTYGNKFQNGYLGRDLSATGVGMKFDFVIVHETGHEWFGNNISMKDIADMWIHEGFANYSENLFVEYHFTEKEAQDYVIGCRARVINDRPIIGTYDVNQAGSGDMYYKAGNMLHAIRHTINDDEKWRAILRGMNQCFWHQTVTTQQIESYINEQSGMDFDLFFDQYLRTTRIPILKYSIAGKQVYYRYENVVKGFAYRVKAKINGREIWLKPTEDSQTLKLESNVKRFELDRNFYVDAVLE